MLFIHLINLIFPTLLLLVSTSNALFSEGNISPRDSTIIYTGYSTTLDFCTSFRNSCINFVGELNYHHQLDCVTTQSGTTILAFCGGILKNSNGDTGSGPTFDFTPDICTSQILSGCKISSSPPQPTLQFDSNSNSGGNSPTSTTSTSATSISPSTTTTTISVQNGGGGNQKLGTSGSTPIDSSTSTILEVGGDAAQSPSTSTITSTISTPAKPNTSTTSGMSLITKSLSISTLSSSSSPSSISTTTTSGTRSTGSVGYLNPMAGTASDLALGSESTGVVSSAAAAAGGRGKLEWGLLVGVGLFGFFLRM